MSESLSESPKSTAARVAERSIASVLLTRRMLVCAAMGFSSGLPLWTNLTLVQAWMRNHGVGLKEIGLFSLTGTPYLIKFLWAPFLDRYCPPWLGRRRGWALIVQLLLLVAIASFGTFDPSRSLVAVAWLAIAVSFFSATQDIAVDAYRRELLSDEELGLGNALAVQAYRVAQLVPGSLALILSDTMPWSGVYLVVAGFMLVGIVTSVLAPEVESGGTVPRTLKEAVVGPFVEFFQRAGVRSALTLLAFMLLYKLGDAMATSLLMPFYIDVGFSNTEIGSVVKGVGLAATIVGSLLGGLIIVKIGINRSLWVFGVVQLASILGFAVLEQTGPLLSALAVVVAFEYLGVGLGTSAFVAFMARTTSKKFTATQYALLSSFIGIPRTLASSSVGYLIEALGYSAFFCLCAILAIPGLLLLPKVAPWGDRRPRVLA